MGDRGSQSRKAGSLVAAFRRRGVAARIRDTNGYDFRARFDKESGAWLAPTVPAPFVNPPVVYRSISLLAGLKSSPFAKDCHYEEAMSTRGMATARREIAVDWVKRAG